MQISQIKYIHDLSEDNVVIILVSLVKRMGLGTKKKSI